jgi:hypothetical protein
MQGEQVNELLAQLNPMMFGTNSKLSLVYVNFADVREQDINANVMPTGMFNALVANIRKHQTLESVPLCATRAETPNVIEVVSGHHRIRAAKQAGVRGGVVLLYQGLSNSEIRAKQLAHNSIAGASDPEIVRELFQQIDDLDARIESFIDPNAFDELPKAVSFDMIDIDPLADSKTVTVVFLPTQLKDFSTAVEFLAEQPDEVYLAARDSFDGFREAVQKVREDLEVVAYPTALAAMARLALERLAQIREGRIREVEQAKVEDRDPEFEEVSVSLDPELLAALEG